jgi:hypothetical protein
MIISASRRTDIPAFYAPWFINRIRAGYCTVPNPFNAHQVRRVSLQPEDVDVIVFWTRSPRPLFPYLAELDALGYQYYFQYTLLGYPPEIDPHSPSRQASLDTFRALAERVGPQRVIWRYDPIVFTERTPPEFHRDQYARIAKELNGYTKRSVISILTVYPKIRRRLERMARQGASLTPPGEGNDGWYSAAWFADLMRDLSSIAVDYDLEVTSCAMEVDLASYGIFPGKCVDDEYIAEVFGLDVVHTKDPGQRNACGCVISRDIGMYDSCLFGCRYCYATSSFARARKNHASHDPRSPSLLGWHEIVRNENIAQLNLL